LFVCLISVLLYQKISSGREDLSDSIRITVMYILTLGKHQPNTQIMSSSLVIQHTLVIITNF